MAKRIVLRAMCSTMSSVPMTLVGGAGSGGLLAGRLPRAGLGHGRLHCSMRGCKAAELAQAERAEVERKDNRDVETGGP